MMLFTEDEKVAINIDDIKQLNLRNIGQYHIIVATTKRGKIYEMLKYRNITDKDAMYNFFMYIKQFNEWKKE